MIALSWLWLLLGFLAPVCVFLVVSYLIRLKPLHLALLVLGTAFIPAFTLWLVIFDSPYWHEGTQIAWTGVKATGSPLSIGGKAEQAIVGWPTGAEEPQLILHPGGTSASQTTIEIKGGGGFVFDENHEQLLNGEPLAVGATRTIGDYQIRVNRLGRSFWAFFRSEIEVLDNNGNQLAGFSLRENRTRSLRLLIAGTPMEDLDKLKDDSARERVIAARQKLEEWAADIWLFRQDSKQVQILSRESSHTHVVQGTSTLSVKWPTMTLTFDVGASRLPDGVAQEELVFKSPWRLASPLPPSKLNECDNPANVQADQLNFMLVGRAQPCDIAFVLPLGGETSEMRDEVTVSTVSAKFNTPDAIDNETPKSPPPGTIVKRHDIGTSQVSRVYGPYSFDLSTVRNLPSRAGTLVLLLFALGIYGAGLTLTLPRMVDSNRILVYGLSLAAWNFLCLRLLLSFRYALDPAALDAHAIEGVRLAFVGLTVVPGLLLLFARLRADRYDGPAEEPQKNRAMFIGIGYLVLLTAAGFVALHAPRDSGQLYRMLTTSASRITFFRGSLRSF
jgi:hypothetical protein